MLARLAGGIDIREYVATKLAEAYGFSIDANEIIGAAVAHAKK